MRSVFLAYSSAAGAVEHIRLPQAETCTTCYLPDYVDDVPNISIFANVSHSSARLETFPNHLLLTSWQDETEGVHIFSDNGQRVKLPVSTLDAVKVFVLCHGQQFSTRAGRWTVIFDNESELGSGLMIPPADHALRKTIPDSRVTVERNEPARPVATRGVSVVPDVLPRVAGEPVGCTPTKNTRTAQLLSMERDCTPRSGAKTGNDSTKLKLEPTVDAVGLCFNCSPEAEIQSAGPKRSSLVQPEQPDESPFPNASVSLPDKARAAQGKTRNSIFEKRAGEASQMIMTKLATTCSTDVVRAAASSSDHSVVHSSASGVPKLGQHSRSKVKRGRQGGEGEETEDQTLLKKVRALKSSSADLVTRPGVTTASQHEQQTSNLSHSTPPIDWTLPRPPRIVFSSDCSLQRKRAVMASIKRLGGTVSSDVQSADILIVPDDQVRKTAKLVLALVLGKVVLMEQWILETHQTAAFRGIIPDYVPRDEAREKAWKFNLRDAVVRGRAPNSVMGRLLNNYHIYISPQLQATLGDNYANFTKIVVAMGALGIIASTPNRDTVVDTSIILGDVDDAIISLTSRLGHHLYHRDLLVISALRGRIDLDSEEFMIKTAIKDEGLNGHRDEDW